MISTHRKEAKSSLKSMELIHSRTIPANAKDRRSGSDTRSEAERQLAGERRSQIDRRSNQGKRADEQPTKDQLSLFAKRIRRAVASGENDFRGYADVLRSLEWIETLARD